MNVIRSLQDQLDEANKLRTEQLSTIETDADNFALELALSSLEAHISDLENQLRKEKQKRQKEVLELRLEGSIAQFGSLPLSVLAGIARYISSALHAASARIRTGQEPRGRIAESIISSLNLRLVGIEPGSSKLLITADTSPNLFGRSMTEESLRGLFNLLTAQEESSLTDSVQILGARSTHNVSSLLKYLSKNDLALDARWTSPTGEQYGWQATTYDIRKLASSLDMLQIHKPERIKISGEVVLLSEKGRLDLKDDSECTHRCNFAHFLIDQVKKLHLGDRITCAINKTTIYNSMTDKEKVTLDLVEIHQNQEET